jgi:hypothetical protein
MKFSEKNVILENVLDENEISQIYSNISQAYDSYVMERYGQQVSNFEMPKSALKKIISYCEEVSGVSGLVLQAYQFSRYEKFVRDDGVVSEPRLIPHYDGFPEPRFTFDYQIKSNTSWPLFVEGKEFVLNDNQALTFSGTHQIHWRSKKEFGPGEFIDMIFCHLFLPGDSKNDEAHWDTMNNKERKFLEMNGDHLL